MKIIKDRIREVFSRINYDSENLRKNNQEWQQRRYRKVKSVFED